MANQYVNKVIVNNEIKMDLTEDTITPKTLRKGFTAHDASGAPIVGNESLTDISEDGTDAGPIAELTANGWANQTQLSGKNLAEPYTKSYSNNGITWDILDDGTIRGTGALTDASSSSVATKAYSLGVLPEGTYTASAKLVSGSASRIAVRVGKGSSSIYVISVEESNTGQAIAQFTADGTAEYYVGPGIAANATFDNSVFKVQVEAGSTATEYEPYCGGIPSPNPNYPQEIRVARGRNLLRFPTWAELSTYPKTNNYYNYPIQVKPNTDYTMSVSYPNNDDGKGYGYVLISTSTTNITYARIAHTSDGYVYNPNRTLRSNNDGILYLNVVASEQQYLALLQSGVKVQLEEGSVTTPYVPYGFVGVEAQGKNLFSIDDYTRTNNGTTCTISDRTRLVITGTSTSESAYAVSNAFDVTNMFKAGETYTLSITSEMINSYIQFNYKRADSGVIRLALIKNTPVTFTVPSDAIYTEVFVGVFGLGAVSCDTRIQLELGSEPTEYEPYYHKTIPVPLPERGWVGGLPDGTSDILKLNAAGKYEWVKNTDEVVLDGNTSSSDLSIQTFENISRASYAPYSFIGASNALFLANRFKSMPPYSGSRNVGEIWCSSVAPRMWFGLPTSVTTPSEAIAYFADHPTTVLHAFATPQTEQGYVPNWDNTLPEHCTIDIPELRDISVRYYLDTASVEPAQRYYERANAELNQVIDDASNDATDAGPLISLQAEGWAEQTQLTGKNLLPNTATSRTVNGVTFTVNSDGSITANGTATDTAVFVLAETSLQAGTYTLSGCPTGGAGDKYDLRILDSNQNVLGFDTGIGTTLTLSSGTYPSRIVIRSGQNATGLVFYPQLELGSTATSYEPYCGGIPSPNPDYPQDIRVAKGRNLLRMPYYNGANYTNNGVTFTVSADGTITANGTATATTYYRIAYKPAFTLVAGQTYTLTGTPSGGSNSTYVMTVTDDKTITYYEHGSGVTFTPTEVFVANIYLIRITILSGYTCNNLVFKPQLELGSVAHPYVPYGYLGCEVGSKNLFSLQTSYTNDTSSAKYVLPDTIIPAIESGTYMLSFDSAQSSGSASVTFKYANGSGTSIQAIPLNGGRATKHFIFNSPVNKVAIYLPANTTISNIQLERGNKATTYEPYHHQTIPIPLPSKGFAAALPDGTSDILRLDGAGKWEWESKTAEIVISGPLGGFTERENHNGLHGTIIPAGSDMTGINSNSARTNILVSHFQAGNTGDGGNPNHSYLTGNGGVIVFNDVDKTTFPSKAEANTWLAENPVTVLYPLANPTIEQGYLDNWDNNIPLHATIDIPELRNIGVECYMDEQASTLNAQWSERLRSEMDSTSTNAVTESLASLAPVENDISSANYSTGSYLIHNNQLYKVTSAIAIGETISTNTNITPATIANELLDIDSDLLDFSELLEAAKAEYREKFQAIDSWQTAASQLIREDNGYYSNESITRMLAQRFDGKLYGYSEPKTTAVAITKTGANAGLANPTLGTATVAGSSAYRHLGPFQWFAAKGIVDSDGVPHVSTIKGIDSDADWNADTNNVWSLRPIQWYSIDSTGGTVIGSLSDTWHLGLKPNPQAYLPDGTLRPYMLASRYALGFENGVGVSKSGFKGYGRDVSHNSLITKLDYVNTGYSGKTIYENWYDIFMSRMIYGTKDFQTIMQGCTSYNLQYHPSVAEQDTTRVILSNANAANLVVGSTMMLGNQATVSTDRNNVNAYNIFDGLIIESITEYDADNKSIELATDTTFNTDPAYLFSTAPWHSGSCDTMDWDGSPTNPLSAKECAFFQGCELMTGVYEVLANIIIKGEADSRQIPYIVHSSRDDATSVTANFVKCGDGLLSNDGTANAWKYPLYIADHNGLLYGEEVGGSTTAGCADGQYVRPDSVASDSEWLSVGTLWNGRYAGLSYVLAYLGLGSTDWGIWSRLSPVGLSRG